MALTWYRELLSMERSIWIFAAVLQTGRNPRDITGLFLISRVSTQDWKETGWIIIIPGN